MDSMKRFRAEEVVLLKRVKSLSLEIEQVSTDGNFPENLLAKLSFLLSNFSHSSRPELQKLAEIPDHLFPGMSLRHFLNFMVPVERLLGGALREDEFLIHSEDRPKSQVQHVPLYFVLVNLRSAFNVGSIFRLADCVGVSGIHLCGYTPRPDPKTSLGTGDLINTRSFARLEDSISELRALNIRICAMETTAQSKNYFELTWHQPTALIVGNERYGLGPEDLRLADEVAAIAMSGVKNSLNVSNALAVAAFEWKRQWTQR